MLQCDAQFHDVGPKPQHHSSQRAIQNITFSFNMRSRKKIAQNKISKQGYQFYNLLFFPNHCFALAVPSSA